MNEAKKEIVPLTWTPDITADKDRLAMHLAALSTPRGFEIPLVRGIAAWIDYALTYADQFGDVLGYNHVLGPAWAMWGAALRHLLNGETGRLDCTTLDSIIYTNLENQGFDPDVL